MQSCPKPQGRRASSTDFDGDDASIDVERLRCHAQKLLDPHRRCWSRPSRCLRPEWQHSYPLHGTESTRLRTEAQAQYIFDPYGSDTSSDANSFLADLLTVIEEVDAFLV